MPIGFALATGFTPVLVGTAVASAVSRHNIAVRVAVVTVFVAVAAALIAGPTGAACTAGMGWLFSNGFLVNGRGDLAWRGVADLDRLAVLAAAAAIGLGGGRSWQRRKDRADEAGAELRPSGGDSDTASLRFLPAPRGPAYLRPAGPTERKGDEMADVMFVALTIAVFAVLGLILKAVEKL